MSGSNSESRKCGGLCQMALRAACCSLVARGAAVIERWVCSWLGWSLALPRSPNARDLGHLAF